MLSSLLRVTATGVFAVLTLVTSGTAQDTLVPGDYGEPVRSVAKVSHSPDAAVVSESTFATAVGVRVLEEGGNAVDAAVAVAFTLTVTEPGGSGLGGRTNILILRPDGDIVGLDGTVVGPASYPGSEGRPAGQNWGYGTIGVPGTVAALAQAVERYGTWPLERVMAPAIQLAKDGYDLPADVARSLNSEADIFRQFPGSRAVYIKADGTPWQAGDRLIQADMARTLEAIATRGADAFYRGEIARRVAADFAANGGYVTEEDLANYRVLDQTIVRGSYRGHDLVSTYLPTAGATAIQILHMLERFDLAALPEAEYAAIVAQALAIGLEDQMRDLADIGPPHEFPRRADADRLVSKGFAAERAAEIRVPGRSDAMRVPDRSWEGLADDEHTTHLSVVDGNGGAVALTQSLGPGFGSRVVTPGLGFPWAATMGHLAGAEAAASMPELRPGDRATARHTPMFVFRDGRLTYVIGGSGARRIITGTVQVLSRSIDRGFTFPEAMAAPRMHWEPSEPDVLQMEVWEDGMGWSAARQDFMREFGFDVRHTQGVGNISAIHFDASAGEYIGVAQPRRWGAAGAPRR